MDEVKRSRLAQAWALLQRNDLHAAKAAFEQIIRADPQNADAWKGIGIVALAGGSPEAATRILSRCLQIAPADIDARWQLANALQSTGQVEASRDQWRLITRQRPEDPKSWENLGIVEQGVGNLVDAAAAYRRAFDLRPSLGLRAKMATLIAPIVASRAAINAERRAMEASLDALLHEPLREPVVDDPMAAGLWTNFYLAYHGQPNRDLQIKTSSMYRRIAPSLSYDAGHCRRPRRPHAPIRIGLVSQFFYNHSIGRTSRGLFAKMDKDRFALTAIFIAPVVDDEYSRFIRQHADRSVIVPQELDEARNLIEAEELDVLFYQDIGMEPFGYFLAHSRLAPVQCVSFGHPDTTGISTIDYFVSNDLYELPGATSHYSERLYLLRDLGSLAYYYRPGLPEKRKLRSDFGLTDADHLYICPQSLFKIHPDMDDLLAEILRRDPRGRIVMIAGRIGHWTELVRRRWSESLVDVADRIVFLPRMNSQDYVNLIAVSDVMLDTVHFNGMNTSLEALAVGTPVVTWPGMLQRSRHTQAMYRKMGMTDCIVGDAQSYVDTALRIASDKDYRSEISARINRLSPCLYEDIQVVREFERFFVETVERAAAEPSPTVEVEN